MEAGPPFAVFGGFRRVGFPAVKGLGFGLNLPQAPEFWVPNFDLWKTLSRGYAKFFGLSH
jgi:hypothetical protein